MTAAVRRVVRCFSRPEPTIHFAPGAVNNLYASERKHDRAPWGPRINLDTINCPSCFGGLPTIRAGGRELCWMGDRGDSYGDKDIYCAKRPLN